VIINKERLPNMEIPKATINFLLERVSLGLEESQFRDIIGLLNWFQLQAKGRRVRAFALVNQFVAQPLGC
jgi:hypothetical protein